MEEVEGLRREAAYGVGGYRNGSAGKALLCNYKGPEFECLEPI